MKELTVEEAALAWAQGKRVEACRKHCVDWQSLVPVAGGEGYYSPQAFVETNHTHPFRFRLAPEPPAKKWRPWSMLEVPVGVLLKQKQANFKVVLIEFDGNDRIVAGRERVMSRNGCFENYEHSIDGGKTWLPCGVEVDA